MPKMKVKIEPRRDGKAASLNVTVQKKNQHGTYENERNFSLNSNGENEVVIESGARVVFESSVSEENAEAKGETGSDSTRSASGQSTNAPERPKGNTPVLNPGRTQVPPPRTTTDPKTAAAAAPLNPPRNTQEKTDTPEVKLVEKKDGHDHK